MYMIRLLVRLDKINRISKIHIKNPTTIEINLKAKIVLRAEEATRETIDPKGNIEITTMTSRALKIEAKTDLAAFLTIKSEFTQMLLTIIIMETEVLDLLADRIIDITTTIGTTTDLRTTMISIRGLLHKININNSKGTIIHRTNLP